MNKDVEIKELGVHESYLKQENFAVTVAIYNTITQVCLGVVFMHFHVAVLCFILSSDLCTKVTLLFNI